MGKERGSDRGEPKSGGETGGGRQEKTTQKRMERWDSRKKAEEERQRKTQSGEGKAGKQAEMDI